MMVTLFIINEIIYTLLNNYSVSNFIHTQPTIFLQNSLNTSVKAHNSIEAQSFPNEMGIYFTSLNKSYHLITNVFEKMWGAAQYLSDGIIKSAKNKCLPLEKKIRRIK